MIQTSSTSHHLSGLSPGSAYSVRVCAVRICGAEAECIVGANSPSSTFKTHKPQPVVTEVKVEERPARPSVLYRALERTINALKPEKEKQYAIMMLFVFFIVGIIIAGLVHYLMG